VSQRHATVATLPETIFFGRAKKKKTLKFFKNVKLLCLELLYKINITLAIIKDRSEYLDDLH